MTMTNMTTNMTNVTNTGAAGPDGRGDVRGGFGARGFQGFADDLDGFDGHDGFPRFPDGSRTAPARAAAAISFPAADASGAGFAAPAQAPAAGFDFANSSEFSRRAACAAGSAAAALERGAAAAAGRASRAAAWAARERFRIFLVFVATMALAAALVAAWDRRPRWVAVFLALRSVYVIAERRGWLRGGAEATGGADADGEPGGAEGAEGATAL